MNRKISVIHPTRGRYKRAKEVYNQVTRLANQPDNLEYLVSVDEDENIKYDFGIVVRNNNKTAIEAINHAATLATGDILIVVSDDFSLPIGWDDQIREATLGYSDWLLKVFDGIQNWIITIPIMDRVFYKRFGYVYCPEYKHMFADTELAAVGDLLGKTITRLDIVFNHNHYSICGGKDKINEKNDKTMSFGEETYLKRYVTMFGLDNNDIVGSINKVHQRWLSSKIEKIEKYDLSILILTITSRRVMFNNIYLNLKKQISKLKLENKIQILVSNDNGSKPVGRKRNELLNMAEGKYICFVDDDDDVSENYINSIYRAIKENKDCIELRGMYFVDGKQIKPFYHSIENKEYSENGNGFYRCPNHLNPIKRDIAIRFPFKEINIGEDTDWALQLRDAKALKTQAKNNSIIYYYKYVSNK